MVKIKQLSYPVMSNVYMFYRESLSSLYKISIRLSIGNEVLLNYGSRIFRIIKIIRIGSKGG